MTQLFEKADQRRAWEVVQHMLEAVPYQVHTILTDLAIGTPLVRETMARAFRSGAAQKPEHKLFSANAFRHDLRSQWD